MAKLLTTSAAAAMVGAFMTVNADSADLYTPTPAEPMPSPEPEFNWTGYYVGGNVGYGWGQNSGSGWDSFKDPDNYGATSYFAAGGNVLPGVKPEGVIGGAQLGYDWQTSPHLVAGLVVDFQLSDMSDSDSDTGTVGRPIPVLSTQSIKASIKWLGTVRARLGYAMENWLFYATGGLAYGRVKTDVELDCFSCGPPQLHAGSRSRTKAGWTAGGGVAYRIASRWSVGAEYLYFDLGKASTTATMVSGTTPDTTFGQTENRRPYRSRQFELSVLARLSARGRAEQPRARRRRIASHVPEKLVQLAGFEPATS